MDKPAGEPQSSREHGSSAIDYLLRTQQQNNLQLSAMADQKASVLLGASFVVASLVMGDLATGNDLEPALVVLAITVVGSGILSALALMPQLRRAGRSQRSANPLFFGFVATSDREDYRKQMREVMSSDQSIYDAIIDDLHSSARVLLESKYRLLQYSYQFLIVGLLVSLGTLLVTLALG